MNFFSYTLRASLQYIRTSTRLEPINLSRWTAL